MASLPTIVVNLIFLFFFRPPEHTTAPATSGERNGASKAVVDDRAERNHRGKCARMDDDCGF